VSEAQKVLVTGGLGFYANVLARLQRETQDKRLNDVTIRLVMQRLSSVEGFEDAYAMTAFSSPTGLESRLR